MTVEIDFPFKFIVPGTPVSLQAKRPESRIAWKNRVRQASIAILPEGYFASGGRISVTMLYFPAAEMEGDIDNIVKPVLDALCKHIYLDDRQVERVWVQKFEPGNVFRPGSPSNVLVVAINADKPLPYVRITDDPREGLA